MIGTIGADVSQSADAIYEMSGDVLTPGESVQFSLMVRGLGSFDLLRDNHGGGGGKGGIFAAQNLPDSKNRLEGRP